MQKKVISGRLISASSDESADIRYASGFDAPDNFLWFECGEVQGVVVSPLEYARAMRECHPDLKILSTSVLFKETGELDPHTALSAYLGVGHWTVPERFPFATAQKLAEKGIEVSCTGGEFFPERRVKTKAEIAKIAESMKVTQNAMLLVQDLMKNSKVNSRGQLVFARRILTSERIRGEVESEFKRQGWSAVRTIIACGTQSAEPHNIGNGPIMAGEPVVADIFPRCDVSGYWGDMTRTFVKGQASPVVRKAFASVKKASEKALSLIRPGVCAAEVHAAAAESMKADGFPTGHDASGRPCGFFHGLGHGVGLEIHEAPRVSPGNRGALEAGNVISVEPGLYYPVWGGIRLEDLVVVTGTSYRNFCTMPKELEVD